MKPIRLSLSGLQSYRELQTVDFDALCEAGVFGIFGPTGSGKSSILDAVTLALYGKVERAANGTQGIMNQSEKMLSVAFTFELSGPGEANRFRVERQFKRGGDVSVSSGVCRFIEMTPQGEAVLADKLADVNRCVEERIGLTMQDFTRAVVLPQGKFAEFLSLTGKERRQMLQRLFSLERFGDGLTSRLSHRVKASEGALAETAAEQQGLGDASQASLEAAASAQLEAAALAAKAREALAAAEAEYGELRQVRELLRERDAKAALLDAREADSPRIDAQERELRRLDAAERLQPALEAFDAAEREVAAASARSEEAGRFYAERQQAAAEAAAAWTAAQREAEEAEPRLAGRREQLAQAELLEREVAALTSEAEASGRHRETAEERARTYAEQAAKAKDLVSRAAARQNELKARLKELELTPEERQRMTGMARQAELLAQGRLRLSEAERELSQSGETASAVEAAVNKAAASKEEAAEALRALQRLLVPALEELRGLQAGWRAEALQLPVWIEQEREREKTLSRLKLAAQLAADLESGAACPVCGSLEHPGAPHAQGSAGDDGALAAAAESIREGERIRSDLNGYLVRLSTLLLNGERTVDQILRTLGEQMAKPAGQPAPVAGSLGLSETAAAGDSAAASLGRLRKRLEEALALAAVLEGQWRESGGHAEALVGAWLESDRRLAQATAELGAQQAALQKAKARMDEAATAAEQQLEAWQASFGDVDPVKAEETIAGWERRDGEAHAAREGLDKSVAFIEEKTALLQEVHRLHQEAMLGAVEAATRLEGQRRLLEERALRLQEATGGRAAAELIRETETALRALRMRVQQCRETHETSSAALGEAAERRSSAGEAAQSAAYRHREAGRKLYEQLASSGFESAGGVRSLLPLLAERAKLAEDIERHREACKQLKAQIELLQERLAGRFVDEERWNVCVARLSAAKADSESTLQAAAKAERAVEELKLKHERWNALERRRMELQAQCSRLGKLQTVFRGNAFVEYVAEEQLVQVCRAASERLGFLTKRRYALEVDSGGGFVIRDDANGGIRRPVGTLSGGETFLASLALALALSSQIQLRGRYPLQFFFLDEGFGTLDPDLLETVITALEKLHTDKLSVGVISHVPELRARLPRRLIVAPAEPSGAGSRIRLETM